MARCVGYSQKSPHSCSQSSIFLTENVGKLCASLCKNRGEKKCLVLDLPCHRGQSNVSYQVRISRRKNIYTDWNSCTSLLITIYIATSCVPSWRTDFFLFHQVDSWWMSCTLKRAEEMSVVSCDHCSVWHTECRKEKKRKSQHRVYTDLKHRSTVLRHWKSNSFPISNFQGTSITTWKVSDLKSCDPKAVLQTEAGYNKVKEMAVAKETSSQKEKKWEKPWQYPPPLPIPICFVFFLLQQKAEFQLTRLADAQERYKKTRTAAWGVFIQAVRTTSRLNSSLSLWNLLSLSTSGS